MSATPRNVIAVLVGIVIGSVVNGTLISLSPSLIPPPSGVDVTNVDDLAANIHLFEPRHFVMPFLAHALGTFTGALVAYVMAATHRARWAYFIGGLFLVGGIAASFMIPAPAWFIAVDLLGAYLPMAWLAIRIGRRVKAEEAIR